MRIAFYATIVLFVICVTSLTAQTYTVSLQANDYTIIENKDSNHEIQMKDFGYLSVPGKPLLPSKTFMVALPPGANVISITSSGTPLEVEGTYKIKPCPMPMPAGKYDNSNEKSMQEYKANLSSTYSSDNYFPSEVAEYDGQGNLRKWRFAYVRFSPFRYRPKSGKLEFYDNITVSISFSAPTKNSVEWYKIQQTLHDDKADHQAKELFVNYDDASKWYQVPKTQRKGGCLLFGENPKGKTWSYVIIIPDMSYLSAVWNFGLWKAITLSPDTVGIASADSIDYYYSGWDRTERIRNFLIDSYTNLGTSYALLVGESYNDDMPMRECWPDPNNHAPDPNENPVPTDYYYADLTGNWDSDGDGYYGEYGDDAVDFAQEISIGRILWSDPGVVQQICTKLINFEQDTGTWKKWALMAGAVMNVSPDPFTDGADLMELIKDSLLVPEGWGYWRLYEKAGLQPSPHPCEDSLCEMNMVGEWSYYCYGYVNWMAHGSHDMVVRTIRTSSGPQQIPFFQNSDIPYLNDNYPSIVYSNACLTSHPDWWNMGQLLLQQGSAGFIGATRVSWYWQGDIHWNHGLNASCNSYYTLHMIRYMQKVGDALYNSKLYYRNRHYSSWHDQANLFVYNLYGDPSMIWQGYTSGVEENIDVVKNSPLSFKISPNPIKDNMALQFSLPYKGIVLLNVYDISGRNIYTILNEQCKAGIHSLKWDTKANNGRKVPAGVYFCRMKCDGVTLTKKFTIIR